MKKTLGVLCSHPIQYYAPLFRYLSASDEIDLKVYYCHRPTPEAQGVGFGVPFQWDVDLLSGYEYHWLENRALKPSLIGFFGSDTPKIGEIICRGKFDAFLVQGWSSKSMWQAMVAAWKTHTPLLVRGDSHLQVKTSVQKRFLKKCFYPLFMKKFSCCLAVGKWSAEYFSHYGATSVGSSPHFVDNQWFIKKYEELIDHRGELREKFNLPRDAFVFLFVGKFEEKKRPLDFLHAFKNLFLKECFKKSVSALMVGDGEYRVACEAFVQQHKLPVVFPGFLNQQALPAAYVVSDALVLPSDGRETWGLVVNEAMVCGLPVLVSDEVGSGPDLVTEEETGFIFSCGDVEDLSKKMLSMIEHKSFSFMREKVMEKIKPFSVEAAAKGILQAVFLSSQEMASQEMASQERGR